MPIYEYACQSCGNEFELLVRSDTELRCPKCQATHLEKKLSVFATSGAEGASAAAAAGPCGACPAGGGGGGGGCAFA
ncbi:MAG: zinc ribbon domain-containing protein [Rubrivivax sp.]|jgi:putative FmdB family regulatory protein|nr:zinc ribbon domain-containing protein [Rubrivivax sp.]